MPGPNRKEAVPPAKPSEGGYVDYPAKVEGMKLRLKSKKFKDHISQAQLFWNSQTPPEKMHLISALGFELDHCDDPIVYECITERLCDIDLELAQAVAEKYVTFLNWFFPCQTHLGVIRHGLGVWHGGIIPQETS